MTVALAFSLWIVFACLAGLVMGKLLAFNERQVDREVECKVIEISLWLEQRER